MLFHDFIYYILNILIIFISIFSLLSQIVIFFNFFALLHFVNLCNPIINYFTYKNDKLLFYSSSDIFSFFGGFNAEILEISSCYG